MESDRGKEGKESGGVGRKKRLTRGSGLSATRERGKRARAVKLGRRPLAGLGPSGSGRGKNGGPRALGCGKKRAEFRMKRISLFFSFSNFSKPIFKRFSNPNLNLIKPLISKI
jgi:hypothetical protein